MGINSFQDFIAAMSGGAASLLGQTDIKGSCLCGSVKYEVSGCPLNRVLCHCKNCRKASGSSFVANSVFLRSQLKTLQGKERLKSYDDKATETGYSLRREFCSNCGSLLFAFPSRPDAESAVFVSTGTMDVDHQSFEHPWKPDQEFFCTARRDWMSPIEGAVQTDRM